jgi:NADH-quinone oxidoreductase subunit F
MDLRLGSDVATAEERGVIDELAARVAPTRDQLLPALHAVQDACGHVGAGALNHLAVVFDVAPAEIYGVASFYDAFRFEPGATTTVHRCIDLSCSLAGPPARSGGDGDGDVRWIDGPCLGLCDQAPAALVTVSGARPARVAVPFATSASIAAAVADPCSASSALVPQHGEPGLRLLRRVGTTDPTSLAAYRAAQGYEALALAVQLGPAGVVAEVTASGLLGRGGAAFPAGRKWAAVANQPAGPRFVVVNADESEPGTFKDRVLLEGDPFAVVEAATIAGFATGAEQGYVYLRDEYPEAEARLAHAIDEARRAGLLGPDVGGHGFAFDLELRRGAGAYICGEETALFNSLEGFRGEPRSKPPFPVEVGLFGRPTLVNNVETIVNVLPVLLDGGAAFAETGTGAAAGSTGTKLFCLSGHVARPGVYEVPFGVTLRELLASAGGVAGDRTLQAVLLGGAAGMFASPDELDVPLTFEGTRSAGLALGSGVVIVFDDTVHLPDVLARIAAFFRHESCGQCVPCRVGTVRQAEVLDRLAVGATDTDLALLDDLALVMRDASICGLGQTAASAISSAVVKFSPYPTTRSS